MTPNKPLRVRGRDRQALGQSLRSGPPTGTTEGLLATFSRGHEVRAQDIAGVGVIIHDDDVEPTEIDQPVIALTILRGSF